MGNSRLQKHSKNRTQTSPDIAIDTDLTHTPAGMVVPEIYSTTLSSPSLSALSALALGHATIPSSRSQIPLPSSSNCLVTCGVSSMTRLSEAHSPRLHHLVALPLAVTLCSTG